MAIAGIQGIIDLYTLQEAQLTHDVTDIMQNITKATKKASEYAVEVSAKKEEVKGEYDSGTAEYQAAMDDINDDYELKMSEISSWESELETQKQQKETELQATTSYKQSYQSALKSNVKTDFTYAQNGQ